jgi:hypothetical protein
MYALYNNTYQIECWKHSHSARLRAVGTKKEKQDFISSRTTWALCNDQVDWVDVGVDPKHLDDRDGEEYSASYSGKVFQTMEGIAIYHDSHVARNHLEKLKIFRFINSVKLIKG